APVSAVVSVIDPRGVLLGDAFETVIAGREHVGLFAPDLQAGAASVQVETAGPVRSAVVARDAAGTVLDLQSVPDGGSTTLAFPVASGTAASTAIALLNTGAAATDLAVAALAADGSVLGLRPMPALPAGATTSVAVADVFAPDVLEALATMQVVADQPLAGTAMARSAAATDVMLTTAPARAGTALGLPLFSEAA